MANRVHFVFVVAFNPLNQNAPADQDIAFQHEQYCKYQQRKNHETHDLPSHSQVATVASEQIHATAQDNGEGSEDEQQAQDKYGVFLAVYTLSTSRGERMSGCLQLQVQKSGGLFSLAESDYLPCLLVGQQCAQQGVVKRMAGFVAGKCTDQRMAEQV